MAGTKYKIDFESNPSFNTVLNLTNRTFDGTNIVSGRGATEDQLLVVHDKIEEIYTWLEEEGCSDDPYVFIKQQLDELDAAQRACCGTDWSANVTQDLYRKIANLEQLIEDCCAQQYSASASASTCDGNVITVSYTWNGANPLSSGGKATATSSKSGRTIVDYKFLCNNGGVYLKTSQASGVGPDWGWTIDTNGNMRATSGTWSGNYAVGIVATDNMGCEGVVSITLPGGASGG